MKHNFNDSFYKPNDILINLNFSNSANFINYINENYEIKKKIIMKLGFKLFYSA